MKWCYIIELRIKLEAVNYQVTPYAAVDSKVLRRRLKIATQSV